MNEHWKNKYLDILEQFDKDKKESSTLEKVLRQITLRLAVAAKGGSKALDQNLHALRIAIRKGENHAKLSLIMDKVSSELVHLDGNINNKQTGYAEFLENLVNDLKLSKEMDNKSKSIKKLLKSRNPPEDKILNRDFHQFFCDCLNISFENGFLSRKNNKQSVLKDHLDSNDDIIGDIVSAQDKKVIEPEITNIDLITTSKKEPVISQLNYDKRNEVEDSFAKLLHNILDTFIDELDYPEKQKNSLRENVFSIKPSKEVHELLFDLAQMIGTNDAFVKDSNETGRTKLTAEICEIVIILLESIPMQENIQKQADLLKNELLTGIDQYELHRAIGSIAQLISMQQLASIQNTKGFQEFLFGMAEKLKQIDIFLAEDLKEHKNSWENGMALGDSVKKYVMEISHSLSKTAELKQLQKVIHSQLNKISKNIEDHHQKENTRVKSIKRQNKLLKNKLELLENESHELKSRIVYSYEQAYTDTLTKLPNRLAYDQKIEEHFNNWQRYHDNLLLMVMDIDYFKKVNDKYGHLIGDEVLIAIAKLLRNNLRKPDFIARFGGEEFVAILPKTTLGMGYKVAEKIRLAVQELDYKHKEHTINITISSGISLFADGDNPKSVFARADKALYQAKKQGRNRCIIDQSHS